MNKCKHITLMPVTATCCECEMSGHQIISRQQEHITELEADLAKHRKIAITTLWHFNEDNVDCDVSLVLDALAEGGYTYPTSNESTQLH